MKSIIVDVKDSNKEKQIISFLKNLKVEFKFQNDKNKLTRKDLVEKLRNPELEGKVEELGDIINFSSNEDWEALKD